MTNDLKERITDELVPEIMALLKEKHNHVLDLVEKEVEKLYTHNITGNVEDILLVRRKDISTIINNLRV